jgi:hypothetical protein
LHHHVAELHAGHGRQRPYFAGIVTGTALARGDGTMLIDPDATVTIGPEENKRLLATAFASPHEDITVTAPSPVAPPGVRVSKRPPPLKALVITSPPPPRA